MIIDSKVVEAKFENSQFLKGISSTLKGLTDLQKGLKLEGAAKGLADITANANKVDLSSIAASTEHIASKFSAMTVAASAALTALVMDATRAAASIAKEMAFGSVMEGWDDYNLKIGATQTIMAGTGEGIGAVTKHLKQLDIYADETIYSLSDMVNNIGKFTNAGVKLPVAVDAMKGISNVAALSGANTNEAARAMYNLGQAIGQGKVRMMDWKSVELANMGTKEFKEQLIDAGKAMGTLKEDSDGVLKSLEGNEVNFKTFSTTLQDEWLTSDVLTKTLGKYADATTKLGKKAYKAAKDIKTLPMLITTLKAAMGTGWTDTFEILVGNLPEAVKMWTKVGDVIGGAIGRSADARNKLLTEFDKLGGRKMIIQGLGDAFKSLMSYIKPLQEGFRDIFPKATAEGMMSAATTFRDFFRSIKMGEESAENLRRTFAGVFAVFGIGWEIIKQIVSSFFDLWGSVSEGSDSFLTATGDIGDFLVELHKVITEGDQLKRFFGGLVKIVRVPLQIIQNIATGVGELFANVNLDGIDTFSVAMERAGERVEQVQTAASKFEKFMSGVADKIGGVGEWIGEKLAGIGDAVAKAFTATNFSMALDAINTGLLAGIVILLRKFFTGDLVKINVGEGMFEGVKTALTEVTNTMKSMQQQIKADTILKIAAALAILTASVLILSTIDDEKLTKALVAAGAGMGGLMLAMKRISSMMGPIATLKIPILAASLVLLSVGLLAVASALKIFASIDGGDVFQSLFSMAAGLAIIAGTMRLMPLNMVITAGQLVLVGVALNLIATAMKIFSTIDPQGILQGLAAMVGSLTVIAATMSVMPKNMLVQAAALTVLGVALNLIAASMLIFATMDPMETGKALLALGGALVVIGLAMRTMPNGPNMILQAIALNAVATALNVMAVALAAMGLMSWEMIAKSLVMLGGSMLILAIGLNAMTGTLLGAAALTVAAGALAVLVPVLLALGSMSIGTIVTGLLALAGIFLVVGAAGLLLAPVAPIILALGAAILLIGAGMALAGAGTLAFVMALAVFVGMLKAAGSGIWNFVKDAIMLIPTVFAAIAVGIVKFAGVIAKSAPQFTKAFAAMIEAGLDAIIRTQPKFREAFFEIIKTGIFVLRSDGIPKLVEAGLEMIIALFEAIEGKISRITELSLLIIARWLEGIAKGLPDVIDSGFELIIAFMNGIGDAARTRGKELGEAGRNMATGIAEGFKEGLKAMMPEVTGSAWDMAKGALEGARAALGIFSPSREFKKLGQYSARGFADGLVGGKEGVRAAWKTMGDLLRTAMRETESDIDRMEDRLKRLREGKENDKQEADIRRIERALKSSRVEYEKLRQAKWDYDRNLDDEYRHLQRLGSAYDSYTAKIEVANQKLRDAIQTRVDYSASIRDQYKDLPELMSSDEEVTSHLGEFVGNLQEQIVKTREFASVLQTLRRLGLNDTMYKELLSKGPGALDFAQELAAGGYRAVDQVNDLQSSLAHSAYGLGITASQELYQAGIDSARGLVEGLQARRGMIRATMESIAREVVYALRRELKLRSPSRVTMEIGDLVTRGLINGLGQSIPQLDRAASQLGEHATSAIRKSISDIDKAFNFDTDVNPKITPVLDLSSFEKETGKIAALLSDQRISLDAAYSKAAHASSGFQANRDAATTTTSDDISPPAEFSFTQNNYSPRALSTAEIYRNTNNQLSRTKGALNATP